MVAPIYAVEISEPNLRGAMASLSQLMLVLGIAFSNTLSIHDTLRWNAISGILMVFPG